ncbi:sugar transferase [Actinomyces sp. MRS3W]|uniref:sugar transferase n=1 Tax=Actinomyces sp. MRS3W TaxID=2800796 RepID=UPI0028FD2ACC|nr:sugar transferase [Actinomyces sp. MRS3W]MDU0347532.1 sugar transferase [Actinomyces sp. MRS3W]
MTNRIFLILVRIGMVLLDALLLSASLALALHLRERIPFFNDQATLNAILMPLSPVIVLSGVVIIALFGGYASRGLVTGTALYRTVMNAQFFAMAFTALLLFLTNTPLSRAFFVLFFALSVPLALLGRFLLRRFLHWFYQREHGGQLVLLVGSPEQTDDIARILRRESWLGLRPIVALSLQDSAAPSEASQDPDPRLMTIIEHQHIDLVLFTGDSVSSATDFRRYAWQLDGHHARLAVVPSLADVSEDRMRMHPVAGMPLVYIEDSHAKAALSTSKRIFDIIGSGLGLIVISPLLLLLALAVKCDGGPALFRQERVGRDGKHFTMLKFRSMVVDAEEQLADLEGGHDTNSVMFKLADDPRVTRVGAFIRRYSLDELPQLINVLRGDMSLVGPRPPLPREVAQYTADEYQRLRVRPGMTGLWQISGRSDLPWEETIRLDLYYIDNWSMLRDLSILLRTGKAVLSSHGAY